MLLVRFELTQHTTFEVAASSSWATGAKLIIFQTIKVLENTTEEAGLEPALFRCQKAMPYRLGDSSMFDKLPGQVSNLHDFRFRGGGLYQIRLPGNK